MNSRYFFLAPIKGYQYISKMFPPSCRYYPSCSEYASWQFALNAPHKALLQSSLRILRCNELFKGGIDYPLIDFYPKRLDAIHTFNPFCGKILITYWLVPKTPNKYYVIKDFDAIKRTTRYAPTP